MIGYRRTNNAAAEGYERGVEDTIAVFLARGGRCGGVIDPRLAEVEARSLLLCQAPVPRHDTLR